MGGVWFKNHPDKLEQEILVLEENGIEVNVDDGLLERDIVQLNCTVPVENSLGLNLNGPLELKINFPDNYPYFRPEVIATNFQLPRHQNVLDGNLCLIPRPTQYWDIPQNIFEYLKERLPIVFEKGTITDEEKIKADPEEQGEPISEYYYSLTNISVLGIRPNLFENALPDTTSDFKILDHGYLDFGFLGDLSKTGIFRSIKEEDEYRFYPTILDDVSFSKCYILDWTNSDSMSLATAIPFIFRKQKEVKKRTKSKWYVLNKLPSCKREKLYDEIINQIRIQDLQKPKRTNIRFNDFKATCFIAVIFPEETVSGEKGWGWLFLIDGEIVKIDGRNQINGKAVRQNTNLILPILSLDKQDYSQRAPVSDVLNGKTISIVGLGTLGAPSAIEFAKNGVSKLKLLDYDFIDTSSTIRWPLGMEYAGMTKTMALKHFIEANFPFTEVEVVNHKIGSTNQILYGQEHLKLNWLFEDCSLLYDASAEEGVNNLLSGISLKHSIPYVSLEARRGGWGGIIARILPKTTKGCWMCLQYHLVDGNISPPREDLKGGIQPRGCGDISFTGASFDLQNISLGGVKVSIKSLENSDDYMDSDVFVVNMVDDSELGIMPQWEKHTLLKHKNCPICNK